MTAHLIPMDDGVRLNVQVDGPADAPAVLFSHSVGCDLSLWDAQYAALKDRFRVIRYDHRGHGGSDVPDGDYTADRIGRDALAVMDWAGAAKVHLAGLSLGATTALQLSLIAPERLRSIILSNASARLGEAAGWQSRADAARAKGMDAMADFSMTRFFSPQFLLAQPAIVARFRQAFADTAAAGYAGCCAVLRDADFRADLHRITTRTLVIAGRDDLPTPPADAEVLAANIKGAALTILPTGHLSAIEAPDLYTARLEAWLS
jgi:3-oxoadipate enol-lactonase